IMFATSESTLGLNRSLLTEYASNVSSGYGNFKMSCISVSFKSVDNQLCVLTSSSMTGCLFFLLCIFANNGLASFVKIVNVINVSITVYNPAIAKALSSVSLKWNGYLTPLWSCGSKKPETGIMHLLSIIELL